MEIETIVFRRLAGRDVVILEGKYHLYEPLTVRDLFIDIRLLGGKTYRIYDYKVTRIDSSFYLVGGHLQLLHEEENSGTA